MYIRIPFHCLCHGYFFFFIYQEDGGTTSDTGKNSWGASSDRSELDNSRPNSVATTTTTRLSSGAMAAPDGVEALVGFSDMDAGEVDGGGGRRKRRSEEGRKKRRNMLFVSGMMGVKRNRLGILRYCCALCGLWRATPVLLPLFGVVQVVVCGGLDRLLLL